MTLEPGLFITPMLRLERKIAEGGMGTVWLAGNTVLGRKVALKFLSPTLRGQSEARARFLREARAIAQLSTPHVPEIFDIATTKDGTPYIALESLSGEDLHARIVRDGPLSTTDTTTVVTHVAAALTEAHARGIIHRDVKPENIFLVPRDDGGFTAKLLDFGIAMAAGPGPGRLTQGDMPMGTPSYMSPEQLYGCGEVDEGADLWSLGVVAYECLSGRLPFEGRTFAAVAASIAEGRFIPPSHLRAVPRAVDAWFTRAFHRDAARRFGDASELSRTLRRAISAREEPILQGCLAAQRPASRTARAHVIGWIVVAAVGVGGTLTFGHAATPQPPKATPLVHSFPPPSPVPFPPPVALTASRAEASADRSEAPPAQRPHLRAARFHPPVSLYPPASSYEEAVIDDVTFNQLPAQPEWTPPETLPAEEPEDNPY